MFDLPMAIGVLLSLNELLISIPENTGFIGALSLDGAIVPVEGMLPAVLAARRLGIKRLYMPYDQKLPVLDFDELEIIYISTLKEVIENLEGKGGSFFPPRIDEIDLHNNNFIDF